MIQKYYPHEYVEDVFSVKYDHLYGLGIRGLIFDIDNTLVHHGEPSNKEVEQLIEYLHKLGFKTLLLSNNSTERIEEFVVNMNTQFISNADKPDTKNYYKALEMLDLPKEKVVMFGDQLFTDILGANKCEMANVLVKYMRYNDEDKIGIKRNIEKVILKFYSWHKPSQNRLGNINGKVDF